MDIEPKQIMTVVMSLILLGIGIFIISTITNTQNISINTIYKSTKTVTDQNLDQTIYSNNKALINISIIQYNGLVWVSISNSYILYNDGNIIVSSGALFK